MTEAPPGTERKPALGILLRTIVVGVDGSPPSQRAVAAAGDLARAFGARVAVVTAVSPPLVYPTDLGPVPGSRTAASSLRRNSEELVTAGVANLQRLGVEATGFVREGSPTEVLLAVAEEERADLLVVGSRGVRRTQRLLVGSVAMSIASTAACPVLLVREGPPAEGASTTATRTAGP